MSHIYYKAEPEVPQQIMSQTDNFDNSVYPNTSLLSSTLKHF